MARCSTTHSTQPVSRKKKPRKFAFISFIHDIRQIADGPSLGSRLGRMILIWPSSPSISPILLIAFNRHIITVLLFIIHLYNAIYILKF